MKRTRQLILLGLALALCAGYAATTVMAQRGPGPGGPMGPGGPGMRPGMMPPMPPAIKAADNGVFTLMAGALIKLDAGALKESGRLQLVELPKPNADQPGPPPGPPPHGPMIVVGNGTGERLAVLLGDKLFIVNTAKMQLVKTVTLPKPPLPDDAVVPDEGAPPPDRRPMPMPMGIEARGQTIYIVRGPDIVAVNATDGSIIAQGTLPKPPPPPDSGG